jgi:Holliday junction resolvase
MIRLHVVEREIAQEWVDAHVKKHTKDYWLRIPDTASGTKPFDGVLYCEHARKVVAIEFKVWREKGPFKWSCVRPHQLRELLLWKRAGGMAWVLVYHERTGKWTVYEPTRERLARALSPLRSRVESR